MKLKNRTLADVLTHWLIIELQGTGFQWEVGTARYRSHATGRFVSEKRVQGLLNNITETETPARIARITEMRNSGQITTATWQRRMATEIKDDHIIQATAGRGGHDAMSAADWGRQGGRLKQEYRRLDRFAQDIADGKLSEAQINARAKMYANGGRTSYYDGQTAANKAAGNDEERRVLNPAEHCADCVGYAAEGWKPIGYFPEPGQGSACMTNCRCHKEYRDSFKAIAEEKAHDPFSGIRPPSGRAPRGLGGVYKLRRRIVSKIETQMKYRSQAEAQISKYRGQTGTRSRWRIDVAKERVRELNKSITTMVDIASDTITDDWGFKAELVDGIIDYTSALRVAAA